MNTVHALEQARVLVENGWCQGSSAKTSDGRSCFASDGLAVQFCADGAVVRATWPWHEEESEDLWHVTWACWDYLGAAIREMYGWDMSEHPVPWQIIHDWNDEPERTKAEVLAVYDRAIELARGG